MNAIVALWWGDSNLAAQYRADLLQAVDRERAENARAPRAERDWRVSRALLQQVRAGWPADAGQAASTPALLAPALHGPALRAPALSLSHARGHALAGTAPPGWRIGVDLEAIMPRDTGRLAQWCFSGDEQAALARCAGEARRLRMFYLLWTLKESFIKAANLDFPADMRLVGLAPPRMEREPALTADSNAGPAVDSNVGQAADSNVGQGAESSVTGPEGCRPWTGWRLRAPGPGWRAWAAVVDNAWIASVVWRPADAAESGSSEAESGSSEAESGGQETPRCPVGGVFPGSQAAPAWHTAQGAVSPRIVPAGQWSC